MKTSRDNYATCQYEHNDLHLSHKLDWSESDENILSVQKFIFHNMSYQKIRWIIFNEVVHYRVYQISFIASIISILRWDFIWFWYYHKVQVI